MLAGTTKRIITGFGRHGVKAAALAVLVAGTLMGGMTGTAAADDDDDRGHRHWKHRGGYERQYDRYDHWRARREWREHRRWHQPPPRVIYAPPPVIYAPPPVVYAPPPPVYYAPRPGFSFGIDIPLR